jgi:glucose/arabinose dehydrogenase
MAAALVAGVLGPIGTGPAAAITLPSGFQEQIVFSGLSAPTDLEFSPDGRIFVAEKGGRIKVFDDLADTTPTVFADLSTNVHDQWDRGLLGLALAPNFPTNPWVYVLYTYDAPPGQVAPQWNDVCPDASNGLCVVTGRLSRLQANGDVMTGTEQVLIHDWCQQYPSHSIGDLEFGADGMLYATGGDGASFSVVDYGNLPSGNPTNPCSDPPNEGGAVRSQDIRTTADETQLDGSLLRLDPTTGAAAAGNPNIGSPDPDTRRIVATGLRNPFRLTMRPGTNEAWISETGWTTWEEVNRVVNPTTGVTNFGWPCYEGVPRQPGYDGANLPVCENLYNPGDTAVTAPFVSWNHSNKLIAGEACPTGSSSSTGVAFYPTSGGPYPAAYNGALFFADYSRNCIWASLPTTPGGLPSASNLITFGSNSATPVDLEIGPGNELYYVDHGGGTIRRIRYFPGNQPPTAVINATPTQGPVPLTVNFDATQSTDPDPADQGKLTYAWDFTNDGTTDSTAATPTFTYTTAGNFTARLTVTDTLGATNSTTVTISPGNQAPTAVIDTPVVGTTWRVGSTITFSGHATDPQQGTLPASALSWQLRLQHCDGTCHTHVLQNWTGVSSGSFTAPDHDYPSYLELQLVATDADGLTHTVVRRLDPQTVDLTFATNPTGLQLTVGSTAQATPFTRTVIQGSTNSVSATSPQSLSGRTYTYVSWSDGGAQTHIITAPTVGTTYTATYADSGPACSDSFGYVCSHGPAAFVPADQTVLTLAGDDNYQQITMPFPVKLYGGSYSTAWVDTNGVIQFVAPMGSAWNHGAIPSLPAANKANLAAYPFWDDFVVDASSSVRTAVTGTSPNRRFNVEWRNVRFYTNASTRVTFEVIFDENGTISFNYAGLDPVAIEQGGEATVGIENGDGTVALAYSYNQPNLRSGDQVQFVPPGAPPPPPPPAPAVVQGTVTNASGGAAIAGATVTVSGTSLTTTTAANGTYSFPDVPAGTRTINAQKTGFLPGSTTVTAVSGSTVTANIALTPAPPCSDSFGYTCTAGPTTWTPADQTVLTLTGDDNYQQITLPFSVRFYGTTYATAWVDTNGVLSFVQPQGSAWNHGAIPSAPAANKANGAVYPFWDDLIVDASASVRTSLTGTAPNRKFIVEWRNVGLFADSSARVSFEVVLSENGDVTVAWQDIGTSALEQGGSATVGIENAAGTVALQYSLNQPNLRSGNGVLFHPPA